MTLSESACWVLGSLSRSKVSSLFIEILVDKDSYSAAFEIIATLWVSTNIGWLEYPPFFNRKYIFKGSIFQPAMLDYRSVYQTG